MRSHGAAREIVDKSLRMRDGSITAMFESIKGGGKVVYSHRQLTKVQVRYALQVIHLPIHALMTLTVRSMFDGQPKICARSR